VAQHSRRDFLESSGAGTFLALSGASLRARAAPLSTLKVGVALVSPAAELGWTKQHTLGAEAIEAALGAKVEISLIDNVYQPQDAERVFRQFASSGHQLVIGNGQNELLAALCGETPSNAGALMLGGEPVGMLGVAERRERGLAFVPEERLGRGAVPDMTLADNGLLTAHKSGVVRKGLIDRTRTETFARSIIEQFRVQCRGPESLAGNLSGGNLQKFIVGREISLTPRVLLVSQPTWGVDVAAAAFLRQSLIDLSRRGAAVLVISEDLEELLEICDRIAVMYQGRLSTATPRSATATDIEQLGLLMAGVGPDPGATLTDARLAPPPPVA